MPGAVKGHWVTLPGAIIRDTCKRIGGSWRKVSRWIGRGATDMDVKDISIDWQEPSV